MQELLHQAREFFGNLQEFLQAFIHDHGAWVYAFLFAIIFIETGLVIMPFLPGDSLLFMVGALAAGGSMDRWGGVWVISLLLVVAGVLGDAVNYQLGRAIGPRVFRGEGNVGFIGRALNRRHLDRAHAFFEKYGGKAVILGRFVPIVRTFVPFVAGAGAMTYSRFFLFNVIGAALWVGACVAAGFFFGNIPWVQKNFEAVVIGIIVVSLIPIAVEFFLARRRARLAAATNP